MKVILEKAVNIDGIKGSITKKYIIVKVRMYGRKSEKISFKAAESMRVLSSSGELKFFSTESLECDF